MTASMWIKNEVAPIAEDDLGFSRTNDVGFIDIDNIPTLHDIIEQSSAFSQDGDDGDQLGESVFWEPADVLELPPPAVMTDSARLVEIEETGLNDLSSNGSTPADHRSDSSQEMLRGIEDVFNLARYEPAQLRRVLMVLAGTFQIIAVAAFWQAIDDKAIAMALVPPVVYSCIGVVAYLLGMKYLRSYFAELRVTESDWLRSEQVLAAADDGVILVTKFGTAHLIWERLLGVAQDNDHYYFLIAPSQGFMVPKQAVRDPALQIRIDDLASLTKARAMQGI